MWFENEEWIDKAKEGKRLNILTTDILFTILPYY